jgi:hypothetical protein
MTCKRSKSKDTDLSRICGTYPVHLHCINSRTKQVTASVENYGILIYCACYKTSIFELIDFRLSSYVEAGIGSACNNGLVKVNQRVGVCGCIKYMKMYMLRTKRK